MRDENRFTTQGRLRPFPLSRIAIPILCATVFTSAWATIEVNSLDDIASPPSGTVTLRSALAAAGSNEKIIFAPELNGETIRLSVIGEEHSVLVGEVMGFDEEENISYLIGYYERDYGSSALYARKNVNIDASDLSEGITIVWDGGTNTARVLAVYGDLTLENVSITGGRSVASDSPLLIGGYEQVSTRARGGALAVWGVALLENCRLYDNSCTSSILDSSRDGGVFGGGIYADIVDIRDCVISGNRISGTGVSGGGIFSVGGAQQSGDISRIERTVITGNSIDGIFAYGAGVYSDGGGIGNLKTLELNNCTIAENLVGVSGPGFLYGSGYWRGGGVYMSNGHLAIRQCTIVENQVYGVARTNELSKPNMAGGVAATIGNAHAAESMTVGQSIITGNTVHEFGGRVYNEDIFSGSLFKFVSEGYNRIGIINFSQILAPLGQPTWYSLVRKHYPKIGDVEGVATTNVLDLTEGIIRSSDIPSSGVNPSNNVIMYYIPKASAVDQVPSVEFGLEHLLGEYNASFSDNFLEILLGRLESHYSLTNFASTFTADFESFLASVDTDDETPGNQPYETPDGHPILTLDDTLWHGPRATWPSKTYNYPYIEFWHRLDVALENENIPGMGQVLLGDDAWAALFDSGALEENESIVMTIWTESYTVEPATSDQAGTTRPRDGLGDIGAIEWPSPYAPPPRLEGISTRDDEVEIRWEGSPGRTYTIWSATTLDFPNWSIYQAGISNALPLNTNTVPATHSAAFFRIGLDPLD